MSNFSNSPLIVHTRLSPNRNSPRNQPISKLTVHHFAGVSSIENIGNWFAQSSARASYNYGIGNDGRIALYVPERDRCWGSSSPANDNRAVVIGLSNSATGGQWPVSNAAWNSLVRLAVDVCRRNSIPRLAFDGTPNGSLTHHRMFSNTICPGPFLLDRFQTLCQEVNRQIETTGEYILFVTLPGYNSSADALAGRNPRTTMQPGRYFVFNSTTAGAVNITRVRGVPGSWINGNLNVDPGNSAAVFRVQVGAFSVRANAEALQRRVRDAGFDAFLVNDNDLFRVQAGSFSVRANAEALLARLRSAGFNDAFINVGHH